MSKWGEGRLIEMLYTSHVMFTFTADGQSQWTQQLHHQDLIQLHQLLLTHPFYQPELQRPQLELCQSKLLGSRRIIVLTILLRKYRWASFNVLTTNERTKRFAEIHLLPWIKDKTSSPKAGTHIYLALHYIWKNKPVTSHRYWWLTSGKWIVAK